MTPVGGTSRHYGGVGIGRPAGWTCPACGALQGGPLEAGCTVCRAGQPGVRVEPDPRDPVVQSHTADVVLRAFDRWVAEDPTSRDLPALRSLVLAAFEGGWQASEARSIPVGQQEVRRNLAVPPLPFPVEGKVARTLAAALAEFIDRVLVEAGEEIEAGEWIDVDEARALVARLKQEGAEPYRD